MRTSNQEMSYFRKTAALILMLLMVPMLLPAQTPENPEVERLLQEARDEAVQLSKDADELEAMTRSDVSWQSHAAMLDEMKEHVNAMGRLVPKLVASRDSASPWQQQAIDRMVPLLKELATNTSAAIQHISQNKLRPTSGSYPEYLRENSETAHQLSDMISSFVRYGQTRAKLQNLEQKLEIASK
jgi:hypothetical protein